ncbi:sialate O-acetylesterase [Pedobacter sp. AK017]|uniref:sialate O-acetylesterase n=1 Tax=Pedobacter sp. AK017 TaxID=2723073 RepID=UPI00160D3F7A|nr:sialate O-acetylesterase [Pedobacter sp. AK017]MBB5440741.1 sialate O-acetylesterase [Pedobacter sp. AK017]
MKPSKFLLLLCTALLFSLNTFSKVTLPAIISSGMVLQQQSNVALWGKAKAGSKVTITTSWNQKAYLATTTKDGSWKLSVPTPKAGGPYTITFNDGEKLVLNDILIGEVWLCSGQSNMEMPVKGFGNQPITNSNELLTDADEPGVRLFRIEKNMSRTPLTELNAKWEHSNSETTGQFSAVGYQFARMLQQKLKVPVGIIQSAYGGTIIEAWMDKKSFAGFTDVKIPADTVKMIKNEPFVLFNAMINPIVGFNIKGALWYQGENNWFTPDTYDKKMEAMVKEWRSIWGCGDFSFYYVQLAPNAYPNGKDKLPVIYEKQAKAMQLIPNSGMAVSVDAGSQTTIHPPDKTIISKRLLYWALNKTYGKKGVAYSGPVYQSLKISDNKAIVSFSEIPIGLTAYNKPLISFEIAGADQVFHPAAATISGKTVVVQSDEVKSPVAVRYAFKDRAEGNLYNAEGLPAAPFRTDSW